jgi:hypothetical protein
MRAERRFLLAWCVQSNVPFSRMQDTWITQRRQRPYDKPVCSCCPPGQQSKAMRWRLDYLRLTGLLGLFGSLRLVAPPEASSIGR